MVKMRKGRKYKKTIVTKMDNTGGKFLVKKKTKKYDDVLKDLKIPKYGMK